MRVPNWVRFWSAKTSTVLVVFLTTTAFAQEGSKEPPTLPPAPKGVKILQNVPYLSAGRAEALDLYLPDAPGDSTFKRPAVVIIHGGGWTGGSKSAAREFNIGTTLALSGYVCASVEYWKGRNRWPTNLWDCKNAVRFLRKNAGKYGIDGGRIGVIGGSAGGHLALMVAYTTGKEELSPSAPYPGIPDSVLACVDMYGPTDLLTRQETLPDGTPNGNFREAGLIPEKRGENEAKWRLVSPVYHVTKDSPPTLILHGMADTTVDRDQSKSLAARLTAAGVEHQLVLLPGIGHTFDLDKWNKKPLPVDVRKTVIDFFDRYLKVGS